MTVTLNGHAEPRLDLVLRRTARRLSREAGDDPVPDEIITAFADAIRPLTDSSGEVARLRAELAELNAQHEAATAELKRLTAELNQARADRNHAQRQVNEAADGVASLPRQAPRADERPPERDVPRRRNGSHSAHLIWNLQPTPPEPTEPPEPAQRSGKQDKGHRHRYPVPAPGGIPEACECGQPYPRARLAEPGEDVEPSEPEPWAEFFK